MLKWNLVHPSMRSYMKTFLLLALVCILNCTIYFADSASNNQLFKNEKAVTFTSQSGQSTEAYEGYIEVPENYLNPDSRLIKVVYIRFPGIGKLQGSPIVYLSGGPGGSGISTAKGRRYDMFQALREFGDVIALDQRGTGLSNDVAACNSSQSSIYVGELSVDDVTNKYREATLECFKFWQNKGVDIYGYTTNQNAQDLEQLRQHLNAEKITLWGISYGSHLAMAADKLMLGKVDKIILASAEGLNQTVKLPAMTDDYFARLESIINQNTKLKSRFPFLRQTMRDVHESLKEQPLKLNVMVRDNQQEISFQHWHMQQLASMAISDPGPFLAVLLTVYYELSSGQTQLLERVLSMGVFSPENIRLNLMSVAMDAASGATEDRYQLIDKQIKDSLLGSMLNFPMPHLRQIDDKLDLDDSFRTKPISKTPLLLFSGSLDGRTYPQSQKQAVEGYSNKVIIDVENAGHNLFMSSPMVLQKMSQFLSGQRVDESDIVLPVPELNLPQRF